MTVLKSVWEKIRINLSSLVIRGANRRKKLLFGSAGLLAFLFAPLAAYALSTNDNTNPSKLSTSINTTNAQTNFTTTPPPEAPVSNNTNSSSQAGFSASMNSNSSGSSQVIVNGEHIPVPDNGSVSKTVQSGDGQTKVDVNIEHNGSSSNSSYSSTNLNVSTNEFDSSSGSNTTTNQ